MSQDIAKTLAAFTLETRLSDLPDDAIGFTKQLVIKTVAGMLAGSAMTSGAKVAEHVRADPDGAEIGIIGKDFRASLWKAVLANAFFAHQSELEDDRLTTGTSWDITTVPMLFPLAERQGLDGAEMLEATIVGLEVMSRTCQFFPQGHMGISVVPSSVAPAALASRVLKLDIDRTTAAFGLAMSGVATCYTNFGTDGHYFETSLQTLNGLIAAQMAAMGLSSNPDLVRYLGGLLGKDKIKVDDLVGGLGRQWQYREIWVKKYPCCLYTHRYIDGLLEIVAKEKIAYDQISRITTHVAGGTMEICNRPDPKTFGDLQFSYQHILGSAAIDGDVNYDHIAENRIDDARLAGARRKVEVVVHPDWTVPLPMKTRARLDVTLNDGRQFSSERMAPTGNIDEPLAMDHVKRLFHKFVREVLPEKDRTFVVDALAELEKLDRKDVARVIAVLTRRQAA